MCAMITRLNLTDGNGAVEGDKVETVYIVHISVIIVIFSLHAVEFGLVDPHVGRQILMCIIYSNVIDGNYDLRLSGLYCPCIESIDITSFCPLILATRILIVPLLGQSRIIERICKLLQADLRYELNYLNSIEA